MWRRLRGWIKRNPITVTGRLLGFATLCTLFALVDATLVGLLSYLVWFLMLAFLFGLLFKPKLEIHLSRLPLVHRGQEFDVVFFVRNTGLLPAYDLRCDLGGEVEGLENVQSFSSDAESEHGTKVVGAIEPGASANLTFKLQATRRGEVRLPDLQIASLFPLGLFRFLIHHTSNVRVIVAPAISTDHGVAAEVQQNQRSAENMGPNKAFGSPEYIGSREYQPGMHVRRWDFASWARLGTPTVREFSEGANSRVAIVLDVERSTKRMLDAKLEAVLECAAGVLHRLELDGIDAQLLFPGVNSSDGKPRLDALSQSPMESLALEQGTLQPIDWQTWGDEVGDTLPEGTAIVAILGERNVPATSSLESLANRGRSVIIREVSATFDSVVRNSGPSSVTGGPV